MRGATLALVLLACACKGTRQEPSPATEAGIAKDAPELEYDEPTRLVRRTERNVRHWDEMRRQGMTRKMAVLRLAIAETVDRNFQTFREVAVEEELYILRMPAVKCLGFAFQKRREARDTLLLLLDDSLPELIATALRGLAILRDPETDLGPVIALCGHGLAGVRANAADALAQLFLVKPTPRRLTPQYHAAVDRLITMLHDTSHTRSRKAAAWALGNMHHPDVLDHLVTALDDPETRVQIAGMRGIQKLGDQRALEPVLEYLEKGPTGEGASWAQQALTAIAVQGDFTKQAAELQPLGTSPRKWREWFRAARNR